MNNESILSDTNPFIRNDDCYRMSSPFTKKGTSLSSSSGVLFNKDENNNNTIRTPHSTATTTTITISSSTTMDNTKVVTTNINNIASTKPSKMPSRSDTDGSTTSNSDDDDENYQSTSPRSNTSMSTSSSSLSSPVSSPLPSPTIIPMIISQAEEMNPTRRSTMEDRCVIHLPGEWDCPDPTMTFIGVYDGHGGREIVDFLDRAMSYHVAEELSVVDDTITMETRLVRAFLMADVNSRLAGLWTSGATVVVCLLKPSPTNPNDIEIITANVGDSRVVLGSYNYNTDKQLKSTSKSRTVQRLTYDHRVDDPKEIARIQQAGGFLFRNRVVGVLAVTRSIGDHILKEFVIGHPYVNQTSIALSKEQQEERQDKDTLEFETKTDESEQGERNVLRTVRRTSTTGGVKNNVLIIACDGLWDALSDDDAVAIVQNYVGPKDQVAQHLINHALERGTTDNVTAVVVWL